MNNLDFTSLRLFASVVDLSSIAHASRVNNIAASAISKRISDLEDRIGVPLIHRLRDGVDATDAGTGPAGGGGGRPGAACAYRCSASMASATWSRRDLGSRSCQGRRAALSGDAADRRVGAGRILGASHAVFLLPRSPQPLLGGTPAGGRVGVADGLTASQAAAAMSSSARSRVRGPKPPIETTTIAIANPISRNTASSPSLCNR